MESNSSNMITNNTNEIKMSQKTTPEEKFKQTKNEPLKFINEYISNIANEMNKQKDKLKSEIDFHFQTMFEKLQLFQKECESELKKRDLDYYDLYHENSVPEKLADLERTLLVYKTCEFQIKTLNLSLDEHGKLNIANGYEEQENELMVWAERKIKNDNWLSFNITEYSEIVDDINQSDTDWLNSMKEFLKNEGLSEKTTEILIQNSYAENWPNAFKAKDSQVKNKEKIKQLICCKFNS